MPGIMDVSHETRIPVSAYRLPPLLASGVWTKSDRAPGTARQGRNLGVVNCRFNTTRRRFSKPSANWKDVKPKRP